jgi:hypothetical protein
MQNINERQALIEFLNEKISYTEHKKWESVRDKKTDCEKYYFWMGLAYSDVKCFFEKVGKYQD